MRGVPAFDLQALPVAAMASVGRIVELPPGAGVRRFLLEVPDAEPETPTADLWVSLSKAAEATGQSAHTIRRLALDGAIASRRGVRQAVLVQVGAVRAWLDGLPGARRAAAAQAEESPLVVAAARLRKRRGGR